MMMTIEIKNEHIMGAIFCRNTCTYKIVVFIPNTIYETNKYLLEPPLILNELPQFTDKKEVFYCKEEIMLSYEAIVDKNYSIKKILKDYYNHDSIKWFISLK